MNCRLFLNPNRDIELELKEKVYGKKSIILKKDSRLFHDSEMIRALKYEIVELELSLSVLHLIIETTN